MGDVIGFPIRKAGEPSSAAPSMRPKFGTILITLLPDGNHQYVREGAYATSAALTIQALSEITSDLATRTLGTE